MDDTTRLEADILVGNAALNADVDAVSLDDQSKHFARCFVAGKYDDVVDSTFIRTILKLDTDSPPGDLDSLSQYLLQLSGRDDQFKMFLVAVSSLQLFVQLNWLGPEGRQDGRRALPLSHDQVLDRLKSNDETVYDLARGLEYLLLAKVILVDHAGCLTSLKSAPWWSVRCCRVHQTLLSELSPEIYERCKAFEEDDKLSDVSPALRALFCVEYSLVMLQYNESNLAKKYSNEAKLKLGLEVEIAGALGTRTRFQEQAIAQVTLSVSLAPHPACDRSHIDDLFDLPSGLTPQDSTIQDDTVLNTVKFANPDDNRLPDLRPMQQALILALCYDALKTNPRYGLSDEVALPYVYATLSQPTAWVVQVAALSVRSRLETESRRKVERSLAQFETLIDVIARPDPPAAARAPLFYAVRCQPKWVLQKEMASVLMKLGCVASALDIFEQLQLWEDVIRCSTVLGRKAKAEKLIRELLDVRETPSLWCHLGDILNDTQFYERAWRLSECRSARAQRSLGYHHMKRGDQSTAIEHFQKSVEVNPLQYSVWFSLGCSAIQQQRYEIAVKSFQWCVKLDHDHFDAWNNLSMAFVRLKQKEKAHRALKEALRCDYENWRIWENYLLVSTDTGRIEEAMLAYHRLLDLKKTYVDLDVLRVFVKAMSGEYKSASGKPMTSCRQKLLELFGRTTSSSPGDSEAWLLYADLRGSGVTGDRVEDEKALACLQKSYRIALQAEGWDRHPDTVSAMMTQLLGLSAAYVTVARACESETDRTRLLSSAKLALRSLHTKVNKLDFVNDCPELLEHLDRVQLELESVTALLQSN